MRKTYIELAIALGAMLGVTGAFVLNVAGIYWQSHGDEGDDKKIKFDKTFVYTANALNVVFSFMVLYVLLVNTDEIGTEKSVLAFLILGGIVLESYLTIMNVGNKNNDIANYFFLGLNLLIKLISVMLGYGVINNPSPMLAGRRNR
jgi:hypothetical protein